MVAFDVEVFPGNNNYRTHKVINNIDLVSALPTDTSLLAADNAITPERGALSLSNSAIAQGNSVVNNQYMQNSGDNYTTHGVFIFQLLKSVLIAALGDSKSCRMLKIFALFPCGVGYTMIALHTGLVASDVSFLFGVCWEAYP